MAKKKRRNHGIPILILIGLVVATIFYLVYGGLMLLRYILGALMFATITIMMIKLLYKYVAKRKLRLPW